MSTSQDNVLWLRPYDEIETHVPECGVRALPGRLAALTHPLNKGRTVLVPDLEIYDPALCTVASSGVQGFERGEVVVLAPDHGAYYPQISPDGREMRIVGVVKPWWESALAKLDASGLRPAPGWMLVERESSGVLWSGSPVLSTFDSQPSTSARVLASCGDDWSEPHKGERVCIAGMRTYTIRYDCPAAPSPRTPVSRGGGKGVGKHDWRNMALVRAPIASKQWLSSLRRPT